MKKLWMSLSFLALSASHSDAIVLPFEAATLIQKSYNEDKSEILFNENDQNPFRLYKTEEIAGFTFRCWVRDDATCFNVEERNGKREFVVTIHHKAPNSINDIKKTIADLFDDEMSFEIIRQQGRLYNETFKDKYPAIVGGKLQQGLYTMLSLGKTTSRVAGAASDAVATTSSSIYGGISNLTSGALSYLPWGGGDQTSTSTSTSTTSNSVPTGIENALSGAQNAVHHCKDWVKNILSSAKTKTQQEILAEKIAELLSQKEASLADQFKQIQDIIAISRADEIIIESNPPENTNDIISNLFSQQIVEPSLAGLYDNVISKMSQFFGNARSDLGQTEEVIDLAQDSFIEEEVNETLPEDATLKDKIKFAIKKFDKVMPARFRDSNLSTVYVAGYDLGGLVAQGVVEAYNLNNAYTFGSIPYYALFSEESPKENKNFENTHLYKVFNYNKRADVRRSIKTGYKVGSDCPLSDTLLDDWDERCKLVEKIHAQCWTSTNKEYLAARYQLMYDFLVHNHSMDSYVTGLQARFDADQIGREKSRLEYKQFVEALQVRQKARDEHRKKAAVKEQLKNAVANLVFKFREQEADQYSFRLNALQSQVLEGISEDLPASEFEVRVAARQKAVLGDYEKAQSEKKGFFGRLFR